MKSQINIMYILLVFATNTRMLGKPLSPTKWHRLRTHYVDIVFRGNIDREAQRIANTLEHLYEPITQSLGTRLTKTTIVLRNQKTDTVSFFTLGPRRTELCTFPSQNHGLIGNNDWLNLLIVHEFRHVAQHAYLKQNFNRLSYWLGGDEFLKGMIFLNFPRWFFEGDAVGIETALSQSGRGRIPYFSLLYKTNLLTRERLSYTKQILGSFKEYVPSCYQTGYYMTTYLRRKYGTNVIAAILQKTTAPNFFFAAFRRVTRNSVRGIYEETNRELKACWQQQLQGLQFTQAKTLHTRKHTDYTDYAYPQLDEHGNVVVLKSGIGTVAKFVKLNEEQHERSIFTPGDIGKNPSFSIAKSKIVWVENIPDIRWKDRSYRVIQCYDVRTKQFKRLTHKSRYGTAALSPDAAQIVACESDEAYNHQLVILDAETGQILKRFPNPDNHFYLKPQWSADGKHIVVVKNIRQRATITLIDVATGKTRDLLPYSTEHLGCPVLSGKYVFYHSAYCGIDNVYAIDLTTHRRYQVTSRKYGAYNPVVSADGHWLIFNDFTKEGMNVAKMPLVPKQWKPLEEVEDRTVHYHEPLVTQEKNDVALENIPQCIYPVKRYHPWQHIFNVHSWLTLKNVSWNTRDPQHSLELLKAVEASILQSEDLLGTTALNIGYLHDFKQKAGQAFAKISYKGCYPIISLEGGLVKIYENNPHYDQRYLNLSLSLPLQSVRGQYTHSLTLQTVSALQKQRTGIFYTQKYQCLASRSSQKSLRDIHPPWSQELDIKYHHTPQKRNYQEQQLRALGKFYFPGFFKHHAISLHTEYATLEKIYDKEWRRKQLKASSLGTYSVTESLHMKVPSVNVMYAFPICYPDLSTGYLFYLKRLRAEVDYCLQRIQEKKTKNNILVSNSLNKGSTCLISKNTNIITSLQYENTVSLTLLADLHLFTFLTIPELSVGIKYLYALEKRTSRFEFVCNMTPGVRRLSRCRRE